MSSGNVIDLEEFLRRNANADDPPGASDLAVRRFLLGKIVEVAERAAETADCLFAFTDGGVDKAMFPPSKVFAEYRRAEFSQIAEGAQLLKETYCAEVGADE